MEAVDIHVVSGIIDILLCEAFVEDHREEINTAIEKDEQSFIAYAVAKIMANHKRELYDLNTHVNILNNAVSEFKGMLENKQDMNNTSLILKSEIHGLHRRRCT